MSRKKLYHIVEYMGDAVYEPAEGGYYVPVTNVCGISVKGYKLKHALREFKKTVKEYSEAYGKPNCLTKFYAHWTTGKYIGDDFELRITTEPAMHETVYTGYC